MCFGLLFIIIKSKYRNTAIRCINIYCGFLFCRSYNSHWCFYEATELTFYIWKYSIFIVFLLSLFIAGIYESPTLQNISIEWFEILYTGVLSAGLGYTLQIIAQRKASPAPAAIILSMEGVFATIAGWLLINQTLDLNKFLGCLAIFTGVIIVQLLPIFKKTNDR